MLFACAFAFSQNEEDFRSYNRLSVSDGLSQSAVIAIEQDQFKQMWIGTRDGLNKYDGEKITIFRNNLNNPNSISNNDISSIKEGVDGFIWIGTHNGLNRFDPKKETFKVYFNSPEDNRSIPHNTTRAIAQMDNGELWFGTTDGLAIYNKKNDEFITYKSNKSDITSLSDNTISTIFKDHKGDIWIGTSSGLNKVINRDKNNLKFKRFSGFIDDSKNFFIQSIVEDQNNNLLIGTRYNGIHVFDKKNSKFIKFNDLYADKVNSSDIRKLRYDNDANLWIGTYNGLFIKKKNNEIIQVINQPGNSKSLSKNSIKDLYVDFNGTVWVGTYYGGVNLWNKFNNNFQSLFNIKDNQAYNLGVVSALQESSDGTLYIGTEDNQIIVIEENGKTNSILTDTLKTSLLDINVKSLFLDDQKLWIGTLKNGIKCFDIERKKFIKSDIDPLLHNLLKDVGIYSIQKIDDHLIFATFGKGLVIYNKLTKKYKTIRQDSDTPNALSNDKIRSLFVDSQKNLWIGADNGLNLIASGENLSSNNIRVQQFYFERKASYGNKILSINEGKKGQIFVGTKDSGLLKLEAGNFEKVNFNLSNKNVVAVYGILKDASGNLWMSCNLGIVNHNPETKKTIVYDQTEGFVGNEFTNNSCLKSKNNNLYFGGVAGISFFNPKTIRKNDYKFKVVLTDLKIDGRNIKKRNVDQAEEFENVTFLKEFTLNHSESSFSIGFAIPNYINKLNNQYAYRLLGLNNQWRFSDIPEANYTIQKPGTYTFQVKEAIMGDITNTKTTSLKIVVKPAPWKTTFAYFSYLFILCLVLYLIYRNMKSKLILSHKLKSERLEKVKQAEINKSKLEFFTNVSHDFKTPLTLVLAPLQQLIKNYKGDKEVFKKLLVIQRNGNQLLKLINQLMDFRAFEEGHLKLNVEEENIAALVEDIYLSFKEYAELKNYTYTFKTESDKILVFYDADKLEKVFYNIISNAFKYTPNGGNITIEIKDIEDTVSIEVSDNGRGIDKKFLDKIFNRYYEVPGVDGWLEQFNNGSGIGLNIAQNIMKLHHGEIKIRSSENEGTVFSIRLKKGERHFIDSELTTVTNRRPELDSYTEQTEITKDQISPKIDLQNTIASADKPKVLIVDDNEEFRQFLYDLLKEYYIVEQSENGQLGFKKTLKFLPDIIISDVVMPKMGGIEFCSKIKSDERTIHIPFVLLTSRSSMPYKYKGLESGADAYINKPFDVNEFLLVIKNQLFTTSQIKNLITVDSIVGDNSNFDSFEDKILRKAIAIVHENIGNSKFDIPYFASELGLSRTMLFNKIKDWTNMTPKEFIISIRMKKASELLEIGELSIAEISYKVGFKDPKYFSKSFKKYYSRTPSEYADKFYS